MTLRREASVFFFAAIASFAVALSLSVNSFGDDKVAHFTRRDAFHTAASIATTSVVLVPRVANSFSMESGESSFSRTQSSSRQRSSSFRTMDAIVNDDFSKPSTDVAYRPLSLDIPEFGVNVPVAMWFPVEDTKLANAAREQTIQRSELSYNHRVSVKKIGELLAGWDFIPDFAAKDFQLQPTIGSVLDGTKMPIPASGPVVYLAHGYLGSRFDLSHLAEALAQEGFICLSAEYPESLAASYPRQPGLDRSIIMSRLEDSLKSDWGVHGTSFGIVGHSAGCGTAITTGDDTWTRVCIAGFPRNRDGSSITGSVLFLSSMNDGAVSPSRFGGRAAIPSDFVQLDESSLPHLSEIPSKASLLFERPDGPNHISFLADGTNDAMIDVLSPLLPVAQAMKIPVLDFDKYKTSRDSKQTAKVVVPLVTSYLKQHMMESKA